MTKEKGEDVMIVVCLFAIVCSLRIVNENAEMVDRWKD